MSLKIFSGVWFIRKNHQRQKNIGDEIPSLAVKIPTTFTRFWRWRLESNGNGQIPMKVAGESGQFSGNLETVARRRQFLGQITRFRHRSNSGLFYWNLGCWISATIAGIQPVLSDSSNWIQKFKNHRQQIRATNKLQCPAVTNSHKRACKNKEFKSTK
jgi:hypothetical protein